MPGLTGLVRKCDHVVFSEGSKSSVCSSLEAVSAHAVVMANAQRPAVREVVPFEGGVMVCSVNLLRTLEYDLNISIHISMTTPYIQH